MPYTTYLYEDYVVESEITRATLRVFKHEERFFSCEVTTSSPTSARITNGSGVMNKGIWKAMEHWLRLEGYKSYTFERGKVKVRDYEL